MQILNNVVGVKTVSWSEISSYELNDLKVADGRDLTKIKNAIINRGFNFPVAIWAGHRYVIDGAGRLSALKQLADEGYTMDEIPVFEVQASSYEQAKMMVLQASSQHGEITKESFQSFSAELPMGDYVGELSLHSKGENLAEDVNKSFEEAVELLAPEGDPDEEVAPPPGDPISVEGDLYEIGEHRLLCGDSTQYHDVQKLMDGTMADMVLTDPPYGISFQDRLKQGDKNGHAKAFGAIEGDDKRGEDLIELIRDALLNAFAVSDNSPFYICAPWRTYTEFKIAIEGAGLEISNCIVWDKKSVGLGEGHYRPQYEFIFYCKGKNWYGDKAQSNVWAFSRGNTGDNVHPTQKPIELLQKALTNSSKKGDTVIDLFGGSGSTMVACEMEGRKAYLCEKDPRYVDVIVTRMKKLFPHLIIKRNGVDFQ